MDGILAQQLLALGEDSRLRKQNLLNLVSYLTLQETRDLTARLSEVEFRTDIVSRLPPELSAIVAGYLEEIDVFPLLNVSRRWRGIWLQPDLVKILSQRCRYLDTCLSNVEVVEQRADNWESLRYEQVRRRRRRFLGKFSSAIEVCSTVGDGDTWLNTGFDLVGLIGAAPGQFDESVRSFIRERPFMADHWDVEDSLYESGRLVSITRPVPQAQADQALIVVEDLHTRTKKVYLTPSVAQYGTSMKLQALGNKIFVAGTSRVM